MNKSAELDANIVKKTILGTYKVAIKQLEEQSEETLFRKIDSKFVLALKDGLLRSNASSYIPVFPVNCTSLQHKDDFMESNIATYKFETLGGNHLRQALTQIVNDDENSSEQTQLVKIYVGLTTSEALRVASDHNTRTHFQRNTSFFEEAVLCRKAMKQLPEDIAKPCPLGKEWRGMCQAMLCREKQSIGALELTFQAAGYSKRCWDKFEMVDRLFSAQALKGQKQKDKTKTISQTPFKHLQGLSEEEKFDLLSQLADGFITLREMMSLADIRKKKRIVKQKIMQNLGDEVTTWEDAVQKCPLHTNDEAITHLCKLNFPKTTLPAAFVQHCDNARKYALEHGTKENTSIDKAKNNITKIQNVDAYVSAIPRPNMTDEQSTEILNRDEAHALIYMQFEQNENQHEVVKTIQSAVTLVDCQTIAVFGTFKQLGYVQAYCKGNQMTTERIFHYSTSLTSKEKTNVLLDHVSCGLICFHNNNERLDEPKHTNMWCYDAKLFIEELVRIFTKPGEWFIQCVADEDVVCVDAIDQGKKLFVFTCNPARDIDYMQRHAERTNNDEEDVDGKISDSDSEDDEPLSKYQKLERDNGDVHSGISDSNGDSS